MPHQQQSTAAAGATIDADSTDHRDPKHYAMINRPANSQLEPDATDSRPESHPDMVRLREAWNLTIRVRSDIDGPRYDTALRVLYVPVSLCGDSELELVASRTHRALLRLGQ